MGTWSRTWTAMPPARTPGPHQPPAAGHRRRWLEPPPAWRWDLRPRPAPAPEACLPPLKALCQQRGSRPDPGGRKERLGLGAEARKTPARRAGRGPRVSEDFVLPQHCPDGPVSAPDSPQPRWMFAGTQPASASPHLMSTAPACT